MNLRLSDLSPCFEGVIPSIIATASADGTPNISYLSHVVRVDENHVALSNQFFAKTAANIRANPFVTLILVDCFTGDQYLLDVRFVRSLDAGPLFDSIARQLAATSAQIGMADVMRLKSADIFQVEEIQMVPSPLEGPPARHERNAVSLTALYDSVRMIEGHNDVEDIIQGLLDSVRNVLACDHALVLVPDPARDCFVTTGSMGYGHSGLGSEVSASEGLIAAAGSSRRPVKVSDASRSRRFGAAIVSEDGASEEQLRAINFPELAGAMSQIAVPLAVRDRLVGILFAESTRRAAFGTDDEAALEMLAAAAARALQASENGAAPVAAPTTLDPFEINGEQKNIRVAHYRFDDSVFVNGAYIVKGIAGALLKQMLEWHRDQGRIDFSNRELRLALAGRMPDLKDNLETRLLLLRRRLEEKKAPLRVVKSGRGHHRLIAQGEVILEPTLK